MIVKEDFLNNLRRYFNLNLYEVKIWTALLSRGVSTAGELSEISDVPRSRAYDILESLEKKGYIVMKLGKPIKYIAVEPQEVIERAKKLVKEEAKENVNKLDSLKGSELMQELDMLHKQGIEFVEPSDLSGAIRGRQNLYLHMDSLLKQAKESVSLMTTDEGISRKWESMKSTFKNLNKKGVSVRVATPLSDTSKSVLKELAKYAEVRVLEDINSRYCIVDNNDIMFMLMHDKEVHPSYDLGVWLKTPFFASTMQNMFDMVWKDLKPLKP
ncbi:TrmB family transcriptional regulator [Candidatus Woesearchaeota archaeon]|nr:MAG: TrmB family transcriptional regulator [Candidatus Woesearchaeota archaeon]